MVGGFSDSTVPGTAPLVKRDGSSLSKVIVGLIKALCVRVGVIDLMAFGRLALERL